MGETFKEGWHYFDLQMKHDYLSLVGDGCKKWEVHKFHFELHPQAFVKESQKLCDVIQRQMLFIDVIGFCQWAPIAPIQPPITYMCMCEDKCHQLFTVS